MNLTKNEPDMNMNYFLSKENNNKQNDTYNLLHNKMNSLYISNASGKERPYKSKINHARYYLNNVGTYNTNQNYFRKINNQFQDDYKNRYNNDNKTDYSRNYLSKGDYRYRNSTLKKNEYLKNVRQIPKLSDSYFYYNNTLDNINHNNQTYCSINTEIPLKKTYKQEYNYNIKNKYSNTSRIPINKITNRRQNDQFNIMGDKYIDKNKEEIENENIKIKINHKKSNDNNKSLDTKIKINHKKSNDNNKSMDAKIKTDENVNSHESHIINVNNKTNIINLSNLNEAFSYASDKYYCFYVNKREKVKPRANNDNNKTININISKYFINKPIKEKNEIPKENQKEETIPKKKEKKISNYKTTYFEHKLKKTDNIKNPLNSNYTEQNLINNQVNNEQIKKV